jgi:hypothetical protein
LSLRTRALVPQNHFKELQEVVGVHRTPHHVSVAPLSQWAEWAPTYPDGRHGKRKQGDGSNPELPNGAAIPRPHVVFQPIAV